MSGYLSFKWSRWIILSVLAVIVGCADGAAKRVEESPPPGGGVVNTQNQTNTAQTTNTMNGAVTTVPQATIEVSTCGQTTTMLLPH